MAIVTQLPVGSYVTEHVLLSRVPRGLIRRLGVDFTSLDEILLAENEFEREHDLEKIPVSGTQVLGLLQEGLFEAIIWNRNGAQRVPDNVTLLSLRDVHKRELATRAAILAVGDAPVCRILVSIFSPEQIALIQQEVLSRQRLPRY
jgi:uncharacterized DUF497 family protein